MATRRRSLLAALLLLLAAAAPGLVLAGKEDRTCSAPAEEIKGPSNYSSALSPGRLAADSAVAGVLSRTVSRRDHAIIDGAARAWSKMPGWDATNVSYVVHPAKGANLVMYLVSMGPGAAAAPKAPIVERFWLVLEGGVEADANGDEIAVPAGHFAHQPPASEAFTSQTITSKRGAKALVFERIFGKADGMPGFVHGAVDDVEPVLEGGDSDGGGSGGGGGSGSGGSALRPLLPDADEWDVYVAVADVRPGRAAPAAAVGARHANLAALLLSGEGIFRLGDGWYPVRAGDAAWAAPYAPQWFAALGTEPARLVVYRDRNTDPLLTS